jgi:hypothetical protein
MPAGVADDDVPFATIVQLIGRARQHDVIVQCGDRTHLFVELHRPHLQRETRYFRMITIVQADADELRWSRDGRQQAHAAQRHLFAAHAFRAAVQKPKVLDSARPLSM